jgi:uncharacterized protein with PIN domain
MRYTGIIIDTFVLLATPYQEENAVYFAEALASAPIGHMPAANLLEAANNIEVPGDRETSKVQELWKPPTLYQLIVSPIYWRAIATL